MRTDYAGQKFQMLTFIKYDHSDGCSAWWLVKCDCGLEKVMRAENVTNPKNKSCGCYRNLRGQKHNAYHGTGGIGKSFLSHTQTRARVKGIKISKDLTTKYLWELYQKQHGLCALTGQQLVLPIDYRAKWQLTTNLSLDRIDSSQGYIPGNVQWVTKDTNFMKQSLSQDQFIRICNLVVAYQKELSCQQY